MNEQRNNPLFQEINRIIQSTAPYQYSEYFLDVVVDGVAHRALKVVNIDSREDYENNCYAELFVEAYVPMGFYVEKIFKNKDNLEVFLTERPFGPVRYVDGKVIGGSTSTLYRAILQNEGLPALEASKGQDIDEHSLDLTDITVIRLQLIDKTVEQLRLIQVGGSYRATTPQALLESILTNSFKAIETQQEYMPIGVDMKEPDNDQIREVYAFEQGTALFDVPGVVQKQLGGVYNTGLGHFIRNLVWYIYPLYNTENFGRDVVNLEVVVVPSNLIIGLDRTWIEDGSSFLVVASGEKQLVEHAAKEQMNFGNGTRFADASGFIERMVEVTEDGRAIASRATRTSEFVSEKSTREFDFAPPSPTRITANSLNEASKLASRAGSYFTCAWDYSHPTKLVPGMNARVKYMDGDTLRLFQGVLIGAEHSTQLIDTGPAAQTYVTSTVLVFFVQRDLDF